MKSGALTSVKLPADWSVETILPIEFQGRELTLEAEEMERKFAKRLNEAARKVEAIATAIDDTGTAAPAS